MASIYHLFNIKTEGPSKVYEALATQEGLASWWTTATAAQPVIGSIISFRFTDDYHKEMKVLELFPDKRVLWECIIGHPQWLGTTISFEIEELGDAVNVRLLHAGWEEETDFFGTCNYHWGLYMKSLKTYIETGKGNPNVYPVENLEELNINQ